MLRRTKPPGCHWFLWMEQQPARPTNMIAGGGSNPTGEDPSRTAITNMRIGTAFMTFGSRVPKSFHLSRTRLSEIVSYALGSLRTRVAVALPIGSEVAVGDVVADDAEVRDEQVVAEGPRSRLFAAPAA